MKISKHSTFSAILPIAMTVFAGIGITRTAPEDAAAERGALIVPFPARNAGMDAADVGGEVGMGEDQSLL